MGNIHGIFLVNAVPSCPLDLYQTRKFENAKKTTAKKKKELDAGWTVKWWLIRYLCKKFMSKYGLPVSA